MNCIDAVEGALKASITHLHQFGQQDNQDTTQFVRSMEAIIGSADDFINDHPEITPTPAVLRQVLYDFAKQLWVADQVPHNTAEDQAPLDTDVADYYGYCFDYLYANGVYPP